MESIEHAPTKQDIIREKSRAVMDAFKGRHQPYPEFDPSDPYKVTNETVMETVDGNDFKGVVIHNVYYDSGVNRDADTGYSEKLVVAGVHGNNIVNYTIPDLSGRDPSDPAAEEIISALDSALEILSKPEEA